MKIRFKQLTKVTAHTNICARTGESDQQVWEFDSGEEIEVASVKYGPIQKVKTRPGQLGGRLRRARIVLPGGRYHPDDQNYPIQHPDYLDNVLETDFEVLKD